MSTFKRNCGIPMDFEGFENPRCPQDIAVFFDDFMGVTFSETADAEIWDATLIGQEALAVTVLDGTDDAEDGAHGILKMLTEATADDGSNCQVNGEHFHLADGYPLYFEARIAVQDVTNMDIFIGLSQQDTSILAAGAVAAANCVGFTLNSKVLSAITGETSWKLTTAKTFSGTTFDNQWIRVAFFWDGDDKVVFSIDWNDDGVFDYVATHKASTVADYISQAIMMTPSIEGIVEATAATEMLYVDYVLCMQQRFSE